VANGVQLATAYISLNVRTDDIKKQVDEAFRDSARRSRSAGSSMGSNLADGLRNAFGGGTLSRLLFAPMELAGVRWAMKAGAAIGGALKKAIMGAASLTGVGSLFAIGGVLTAGLDRLKTLQRAEVQLSLKLSPQEIKQVKADITKVVEGTPISLDAALQAVPKAINAGLRGKELSQYIKDVADMTAASGGQASFQQLDVILSQIRSKSKLTGEEMAQLIDAGVDVRGMLKETFSWDDKTLNKALKDGKVGINEIQKATQKLYGSQGGGLAKQFGKTFEGAMGNLKASAARLGANILDVIFGSKDGDDPLQGAVNGVSALTDRLNDAGKWVAENKTEIRNVFTDIGNAVGFVGEKISDVVDWFRRMGQTGRDIGGSLGRAWDNVTTSIGKVGDKIKSVTDTIKTKIGSVIEDLKKKFDAVFGENGWFAQQFKKVADLVDKVRDVLGLGPATASAAAPGGSAGGAFNPGPMAPGVAAGQAPLGGSTMGLSSVPQFGFDANGNPLQSTGAAGSSGLSARMPTKSAVGAPIYQGGVTEDTGGAVEPRNAMVQDLIQQKFGDVGAWIGNDYRKPDGYNEHSSGQAADIMVNELGKRSDESIELGNKINKWLIDNAEKIGLQYTIWNGMLYRPDGSTSANRGQGITGNHEDHVHYRVNPGKIDELPQFSNGGGVWGSGTGTSDSIPAMLSNGEHVLTAADVKKMGGQGGVYNFRKMLGMGMIPGFAPGGAVDDSTMQDMQNNLADLRNQSIVAQQQFNEVLNSGDASESAILQARINMEKSLRSLNQFAADMPIIASGGTPPDRSAENSVLDSTDQLALALQGQKDLPEDASVSQRTQSDYGVEAARRSREQSIAALNGGENKDYGGEFLRTLGFIPATAGNTGVAGTSSLAKVIGMGNDVVGGLIDTGASLAQTAVNAGMAAGTFGGSALAGPAAGAAAGYGIQLGAETLKRISSYGFQMAGIGADSLVEQLFPFGAPRWLGYDYAGFAPNLNIMGAATSTIEQMGGDAIKKHMAGGNNFQVPGEPTVNTDASGPTAGTAAPAPVPMQPNQQILQPGDPGFYSPGVAVDPFNPNGAGGGGGGGSWAKGGHVGIYDNGGVLKPGQLAFNASRTPESILTKQQWNAMAATASNPPKGSAPLVENLYAQDMQDAIRQLDKVKRRDMMQYAGRP
jgi:tape measure domain-containing protein